MNDLSKRSNNLDKFFDDIFNVTFKNGFPNFYEAEDGFPFHDIYEDENGNLSLEIAVAGYDKKDISIQVENGYLIVKAVKTDDENDNRKKYHYKRISKKAFEKIWKIPSKFNDSPKAEFRDGILKIEFQVDEQKKPKLINID